MLLADPSGLWVQPFFQAMHRALKPGGVICTQARTTPALLDPFVLAGPMHRHVSDPLEVLWPCGESKYLRH